jgi:hypothetical protein
LNILKLKGSASNILIDQNSIVTYRLGNRQPALLRARQRIAKRHNEAENDNSSNGGAMRLDTIPVQRTQFRIELQSIHCPSKFF